MGSVNWDKVHSLIESDNDPFVRSFVERLHDIYKEPKEGMRLSYDELIKAIIEADKDGANKRTRIIYDMDKEIKDAMYDPTTDTFYLW